VIGQHRMKSNAGCGKIGRGLRYMIEATRSARKVARSPVAASSAGVNQACGAMMLRQIVRSYAATVLAAGNHRSLAAMRRQSCSVSFRRAHSVCNHRIMATIREINLLGQIQRLSVLDLSSSATMALSAVLLQSCSAEPCSANDAFDGRPRAARW